MDCSNKPKQSCCARVKSLQAGKAVVDRQLKIALRALLQYKLEANALVANDALDRMKVVGPLPEVQLGSD